LSHARAQAIAQRDAALSALETARIGGVERLVDATASARDDLLQLTAAHEEARVRDARDAQRVLSAWSDKFEMALGEARSAIAAQFETRVSELQTARDVAELDNTKLRIELDRSAKVSCGCVYVESEPCTSGVASA
jgi:hypothetical protein